MWFLFICAIPVFRISRRVESSGKPEIALQNLVYGSIIITAWGLGRKLFVYVIYCILRYSDVIPVIPVIPLFQAPLL